ncbi:MAG TPA: DUF1173 family protein [Burkholderiaceae bacterium]|nr:DUF1173 family protein [Burkholderiaceae bacterium]
MTASTAASKRRPGQSGASGRGTFGVSNAGVPAIVEISLMPVTAQWLPIEDSFERQLVEHLVADGRAFIKGLRYNLHRDQCVATAMLTDTRDAAFFMFVVSPGLEGVALAGGNQLRESSRRCVGLGLEAGVRSHAPVSFAQSCRHSRRGCLTLRSGSTPQRLCRWHSVQSRTSASD